MANGADLPPLREVIARHGLAARKKLGQHFLLDGNLTAKIARAAGDLSGATAIEVGPGPGGLTRALLAGPAREVITIERDARCIAALQELAARYPGRLTVIEGDAKKIDADRLGEPPRHIVANLPYNISTVLLLKWLDRATAFESMTLMFQKEVATRLAAAPGGRDYGRLSVAAQWRCAVHIAFDISPSAFVPPPKVTSTVVRLIPRAAPLCEADAAMLSRVVAAAFGGRRKMLRASLRALAGGGGELCDAAGVDPTDRAEDIPIEGYCALARAYAAAVRRRSGDS